VEVQRDTAPKSRAARRLPLLLSDGRGVGQVQIFDTILLGLSTIFSFIKPFSSNQEVVIIFRCRSIYDCDRKAAAVVVDLFGRMSFLVTFCISLKKTSLQRR
jgi:hypothetical protein